MAMTPFNSDSRLRVSRRGFLKASGVGAATAVAGGLGAISFSQSRAAAQQGWDEEYDIVVVGSGGAGFAAAVTARHLGSEVVVLEKGSYVGGTTLVSGAGMWIPNNSQMREAGIEDPRDEALKYMARYSWPHLYNPDDEKLGLTDHDYEMISVYYDTAAEAMDFIESSGAQTWAMQTIVNTDGLLNVDYQDHFEENVPKHGRTLAPLDADGNQGGGGLLIGNYQAWCEANGVPIRLNHRVERVVLNDAGQVVGVEVTVTDPAAAAATPEATPVPAQTLAIRARKGVIFGSGGFARNEDMMHNFMPGPYYGGCSAPTNEGDFLKIAAGLNAKLGNLHNAWRNEGIFEQAIADSGNYNCTWYYKGDSMLMVNRDGRRFVNERRNYQDRPMAHFDWDPNWATWENLLGILVYDQRVQDSWGGEFPYPQDPDTTPYVIKADTLDALADAIIERVNGLSAVTKGMEIREGFKENFLAEVQKFNEYAVAGVDPDFERGEFGYDEAWNSNPSAATANLDPWPSPDQPNKAMYPLAETGPYYAIVMTPSAVDTNGGPVINSDAQILTWNDEPIEGLYGAGNCIANPSVNAYWGGGATLGNAHVWGYRAAVHAHDSTEKSA